MGEHARRLASRMRAAGYEKAAAHLPEHLLSHPIPCTRHDRGGERVRIRWGGPMESRDGLVAMRLDPKQRHREREAQLICTEHIIRYYRPVPAHRGAPRLLNGDVCRITISLPADLRRWVEDSYPDDSFAAAVRSILEAHREAST